MKEHSDKSKHVSPGEVSKNPFRLPMNSLIARPLERLLGLSKLINTYDRRPQDSADSDAFLRYTESAFGTIVQESGFDIRQLPTEGPLLFVANHPLGGLEGVVLARVLREVRPDTKVLTNQLLTQIPELSDIFIGVDVLNGQSEKRAGANLKGLREATNHLKNGGALLVFPAGKVATYDISAKRIQDHPWNRIVGSLVKKANPACMPIFVDGRNSIAFYALSLIHPILRTLMLPRELSNKSGYKLGLVFGEPLDARDFRYCETPGQITDYLRLSTDLLNPNNKNKKKYKGVKFDPLEESDLESDHTLDHLQDSHLIAGERFDVYCATYERLGDFINVIGAAREVTFRAAGEGTGNAIDVDRFDPHYEHLFIWDKENRAVVGGYRIGRVDEIVARSGIDALYSRTLYEFSEDYLSVIGQPLEMGRSFVHPDYQRMPQALDLLWRGIGQFVAQNPKYHTLFGAVSISNEHSDLARALIAETMIESFRAEQKFLENVRPVAPLKVSGKVWTRAMLASLNHIALVNKLVGRCDPGMTLPTLLRHYLSLNGKFVCFSVNKVFNDSLDGLILVDLRETPAKYLRRYLGKEGAEHFIEHWKSRETDKQKIAS